MPSVFYKAARAVLAALAIASCHTPHVMETGDGRMDTIDLNHAGHKEAILFSEFAESPEAVILETTASCVIQNIRAIDIHNNRIYILDDERGALLVFDLDGKFLRQIGDRGNGRGEFVEVSDFSIDREANVIYLLDDAKNIINLYDVDTGKYISSVKTQREGYRSYNMAYVDGKIYLSRCSDVPDGESCEIIQVNANDGVLEGSFISSQEYNNGWNLPLQLETSLFYCKNTDSPKYVGLFSNYIFSIDREGVSPSFYVDNDQFVTRKDTKELMDKYLNDNHTYDFTSLYEKGKAFMVSSLCQVGHRYCFTYQEGMKTISAFYDTEQRETVTADAVCNDYLSTEHPAPMPIIWGNDSLVVGILKPSAFALFNSEVLQKGKRENKCPEPLREDDNPILFIHKLK